MSRPIRTVLPFCRRKRPGAAKFFKKPIVISLEIVYIESNHARRDRSMKIASFILKVAAMGLAAAAVVCAVTAHLCASLQDAE